jgi:hypothetical protein
MGTSIILNSDIIQVSRAQTITDQYNRVVKDWTNATVVASGRASIQHYLALEEDIDRETTTEGARFITDDPALKDQILPEDRVIYAGETWEVTSPAQDWRLFGRYHHTEMFVRRVVG